jgi:hypothetical protein
VSDFVINLIRRATGLTASSAPHSFLESRLPARDVEEPDDMPRDSTLPAGPRDVTADSPGPVGELVEARSSQLDSLRPREIGQTAISPRRVICEERPSQHPAGTPLDSAPQHLSRRLEDLALLSDSGLAPKLTLPAESIRATDKERERAPVSIRSSSAGAESSRQLLEVSAAEVLIPRTHAREHFGPVAALDDGTNGPETRGSRMAASQISEMTRLSPPVSGEGRPAPLISRGLHLEEAPTEVALRPRGGTERRGLGADSVEGPGDSEPRRVEVRIGRVEVRMPQAPPAPGPARAEKSRPIERNTLARRYLDRSWY